jgi:predicted ATPase
VNRAARVMGTANGGQIVCSVATAGLCPERVFRDAGEHELTGVGVEQLFVLTGVGVGAGLGLRSVSMAVTNLPVEASSFVGRAGDVSELSAAVLSGRLVTLVGPGGVGKTRLAIEAASAISDRFGDGVWLCELASVIDADSVAATVAETIGARAQAGMDLIESIGSFLEHRRALIVLDNCEHVLDTAIRLVRRLVAVDGVAVLATSRELLGVRDEQLWPVGPLDSEASVELFIDRCRQRDPHFEVDDEQLAAVTEIGRRLDGIPLALELAAARTTALSPAAIAGRLEDRFRLLRGERHQTLRDTLQWSYDLLSPAEAALFDRLAVFTGGFTLTAAEAVCADGEIVDEFDVIDLVVALVDKSMVQRDRSSADRFMLLETLRQFGEDQLHTKGITGEYRDRHARFFSELAVNEDARIFGPTEIEAWAVLDAEWDNLRTAFSHLVHAGDVETASRLVLALYFFSFFAMRDELGEWATTLLDHPSSPTVTGLDRLSGVLSWGANFTGDIELAIRLFDAAVERQSVDPIYFSTSSLMAHLDNGDLSRAERCATVLRDSADPGDPRSMYFGAIVQPLYFASTHQTDEAVSWADQALRIASDSGSQSGIALALHQRGLAQRDDLDQARRNSQEAFDTAVAVSPRHMAVDGGLVILARIAASGDDLLEGLEAGKAAVAYSAGAHYLGSLAISLQSAVIVLARAGDPQTPGRLLRSIRRHGYRATRRAESAVTESLGPAAFTESREDQISMLETAQVALDAIDTQITRLTAEQGTEA